MASLIEELMFLEREDLDRKVPTGGLAGLSFFFFALTSVAKLNGSILVAGFLGPGLGDAGGGGGGGGVGHFFFSTAAFTVAEEVVEEGLLPMLLALIIVPPLETAGSEVAADCFFFILWG